MAQAGALVAQPATPVVRAMSARTTAPSFMVLLTRSTLPGRRRHNPKLSARLLLSVQLRITGMIISAALDLGLVLRGDHPVRVGT